MVAAGKPLLIIALVIFVFAAAAHIVSMVTMFWKIRPTTVDCGYNYNLYRRCNHKNATVAEECYDFGWNQKGFGLEILTTRILMLVGAVLIVLGMLIGILRFFGDEMATATNGMFVTAGAIIILVACGVFTGFTFQEKSYYGYSFYLAWASGGLFLLTGCLLCCSAYNKKEA